MTQPLLAVEGLVKHFALKSENWFDRSRPLVRAVDNVSFSVGHRETLALVGESGCGKSTTGRLILQLIDPTAGAVRFEGADLVTMAPQALRRARKDLQIIFQDPHASLNPRMSVEDIILEPLYAQGERPSAAMRTYAGDLLEKVGLSRRHAQRFAHEFSGGQRQRIGIARAIAPKPKFVICDEAVSALDVSVQAQIINLLQDLQEELGMSYLFIGHDLAVVRHIADRVAVMYLGRIVETAPKTTIYAAPRHPYTQALLASAPVPHPRLRKTRNRLRGEMPSPLNPPSGCHFHPRCPLAQDVCKTDDPVLRTLESGHEVACHFAELTAGGPAPRPS
ncbi:ATP-binding cassette domain-containing protein [Arsenicitalea aurantiaca]|uniref:ATP-binding cassette domain-containing protein n=1 Tax=Arsenicitalea aurantiaca TaxID=1783274 RepID=A0A433XBE0_9HYPH|nr:oligopeptide/dipeptide ABC transporter ATP-binding protein [Arsenicitalea aurantiaca]RUT31395.1 ATP-binding cassette domain-containing protein [Arsenicitalea aurantiaca]